MKTFAIWLEAKQLCEKCGTFPRIKGERYCAGCKKDVPGCTDFAAYNFNSAATVDNGTCVYYGTLTFFVANPTYSNITVTINNHTDSITQCYQSGPPSCSAMGCANLTLPAGTYYYTGHSTQKTWGITTPDSVVVVANQCQLQFLP